MIREDPVLELQSKNRREHRRKARARLFHAARKRAFREHPFVCWTNSLLVAISIVLIITHVCIVIMHNETEISWLLWTSFGLMVVPQVWLATALRLGPLSPKRKSRALFWQGVRYTILATTIYVSVQVFIVTIALLYLLKSTFSMLGNQLPEYIWTGLWGRGGQGGLIGLYVAYFLGLIAALYISYRLKLFIRRLQGRCVRCDYSLRGLEEARCPECGTPFNVADLESLRPKSAYAKDDA